MFRELFTCWNRRMFVLKVIVVQPGWKCSRCYCCVQTRGMEEHSKLLCREYGDFVFPSTVILETLSATANGSWRLVSARIAGVIKPCVDRCWSLCGSGFVKTSHPRNCFYVDFSQAGEFLDLICTRVNLVKYNENIFCKETFNTALSLKHIKKCVQS